MQLTESDTGLGTIYERMSIYSLLARLSRELGIRSCLEGPTDGIMGINGINSIVLAKYGIDTHVVLPDEQLIRYARQFYEVEGCRSNVNFTCSRHLPFRRNFDLVWNFNCLPQREDHERILEQMAGCSKRYVLTFVPNTRNYGFWIHRLHHIVAKEDWCHGDVGTMNLRRIAGSLNRMGFRTVHHYFVDIPWWPDIHSIEDVLGTFLPFLKRSLKNPKRLEIHRYNSENFPYFHEGRRKELLQTLSSHPNFEDSRIPLLKCLFAHHQGILAEKML